VRLKVRAWGEKEVLPHMTPFIEEAKFPESIMNKMKELNIFEHFLKPPYGKPISTSGMGMIMAELARADASVATAVTVTWGLAMFTIEALGSEEQKAKYLPKMKALEWLGGWGLTEEKVGSDASNLQTTVTKTHEGYRLNGNKRWIGNGNRDVLIIWARNTENNKVEGMKRSKRRLRDGDLHSWNNHHRHQE
jgi:acyl-CoA oxidase